MSIKEVRLVKISGEFPLSGSVKEYRKLNPRTWKLMRKFAGKLKRQNIIHVNSTHYGGGVAELLKSEVAWENYLGLRSHWFTIKAPRKFFSVTKKIHNFLQGRSGPLSAVEKFLYSETTSTLGKQFANICRQLNSPMVVIHDPQPLPLVAYVPKDSFSILRFHLDLSAPNPNILELLRPLIGKYRLVVISNPSYASSFSYLKKSKIKVIFPAIDPLSEKNRDMNLKTAQGIIEQLGINPTRPIITQVSRFDPWKDPLGVIRAYYLAKNKVPELQLVLAGLFEAKDDPEAISIFEKVKRHARGDPDIHLFSEPRELGRIANNVFINALYTVSSVVIQKSLREGFGLTITEAMWKGKPVVAGVSSGPSLQIKNGKNGILVSSPEATAKAVVRLLKNRRLAKRLGRAAHQSVKNKFLISRFILDNLRVYTSLKGSGPYRI